MKVKVQVLDDENDEVMPKEHKYYGCLKYAHAKYFADSMTLQKQATMYSILAEMAKNHPDELIQIWNEIRDVEILHFEEDDPLYNAIDVNDLLLVYYDIYKVYKIEHGKVYFDLYEKRR